MAAILFKGLVVPWSQRLPRWESCWGLCACPCCFPQPAQGGWLTPRLWWEGAPPTPKCLIANCLIWFSCPCNSSLYILPPFYILHVDFSPFTHTSWCYPALPAGKFVQLSLIFQPSLLALLFPFSFLPSHSWLQSSFPVWPLILFPGMDLICICPSIQATN